MLKCHQRWLEGCESRRSLAYYLRQELRDLGQERQQEPAQRVSQLGLREAEVFGREVEVLRGESGQIYLRRGGGGGGGVK
jgi:hypothetical protein